MISDIKWVERKEWDDDLEATRVAKVLQVLVPHFSYMGADSHPQYGDYRWIDVRTEQEDETVQS